ncbi:MAG: alpha/beta fold hydrolase [Actinomycetota bacterium]
MTPPGAAERVAKAIKGAELSVVQGTGHMSMLERPDVVNAELRRFLAKVPALAG